MRLKLVNSSSSVVCRLTMGEPRRWKKPVTMRLDADVVDWLKSYGRGYQTRANSLLRHAMLSARERKQNKSA